MAGDWIMMRKALLADPKVVRISSALNADRFRTVGGIFSAWCLFDDQTEDGRLDGYTPALFDEIVGWPGLASAMVAVDWLIVGDGFLQASRFEEYNSKSAKRRLKDSVRKMSAREADKKQTKIGLQNSRVEYIIKNTPPEFCPCSVEQAISYAPNVRMSADQAEHWWNVRNASGWTKGSTGGGTPRRITSWQSDMATSLSWVAESMQKAAGAAKVARGRIAPDIGGRRPSSVASMDDAKPLRPEDLEEIQF